MLNTCINVKQVTALSRGSAWCERRRSLLSACQPAGRGQTLNFTHLLQSEVRTSATDSDAFALSADTQDPVVCMDPKATWRYGITAGSRGIAHQALHPRYRAAGWLC